LTPYSLVSWEWHDFFAGKLFERLTVTPGPDFARLPVLAHGQGARVKHLWLRIPLAPYTCNWCRSPEDARWHGQNIDTVQATIDRFLTRLLYWSWRAGFPTHATLEISIHSPSDRLHGYGHYDMDAVPEGLGRALPSEGSDTVDPAAQHTLSMYQTTPVNRLGATWRLYGRTAMDLRYQGELTKADFITRLLIRRQTRRRLTPASTCQLLAALPNLEELALEFWREPTALDQQATDTGAGHAGHAFMLGNALPASLTRLKLFEDSSDEMTIAFRPLPGAQEVRTADPQVAQALAARSLGLEQAAVAFVVEAADFFAAGQREWRWSKLESLSLTSRLLRSGSIPAANGMLYHAAGVVKQMSRLRILEIWNGGTRIGRLFRYEVAGDEATITWKGFSEDERLERRVNEAWENVARERGAGKVTYRFEMLDNEKVWSHGHAIVGLGLKVPVADNGSVTQMMAETWPGQGGCDG
ncbi:hypothetical protein C8A05DRAFT_17314, partial [Staphylotrichum tortipilum]